MTEAMIRQKPGMEMPFLLDGPPPVLYPRRIPNKGPCAIAIFLTAFGAFSYGMYQVGGETRSDAFNEEKYAAHRAIIPLIQAEEDERFVMEWKKVLPGWKVGENVYHSGRWMPPATGELRPNFLVSTF